MNAAAVHEVESMTRSIARWGSAAATIIFGIAFVTDRALSWRIVSSQVIQIGLIVAIFAFYALAWSKRFEVLGSVVALVSLIAMYLAYMVPLDGPPTPNLWFLVVGVPALFHLVAVVLHRYVLPHVKQ